MKNWFLRAYAFESNSVLIITMIGNRLISSFVACFLLLLLINDFTSATPTDVHCLRTIKSSLQDPNGYLSSWDFSNVTEGKICEFAGVLCWHNDENRVLSITLSDMGLKGQFPRGIVNCTSLTGLDLSNNQFSGQIPYDISVIATSLTILNLSSNVFTGPIPKSLSNCSYLNVLKLDRNRLSGEIPPELTLLYRLTKFSVANNLLHGPIPQFRNVIMKPDMFANNTALCGKPLKPCHSPSTQPLNG